MKDTCIVLLLAALPVAAAEPFTGTWKLDVSKAQFSRKPEKFEIANGTYKCLTCEPPISVKADGSDQPVSGHPAFDAENVRIVGPDTLEMTEKKAGKVVTRVKVMVSGDGSAAIEEFTAYPKNGSQPVTGKMALKRVGKNEPGMHAASGSWVVEKAEDISENDLLVTFEQTADSLKMTEPTGEHYEAKFDGTEYPYEGSREADKVTLKRLGSRSIEEIDKFGPKVIGTTQMTVAPDGRSLTMVVHESNGHIATFVFNKQ